MFMQLFFSKVHPACHNIVNGIEPGSNSKKTDKHVGIAQKLYFRAKGICLLDKKAILVYTGKFACK